MGIVSHLDGAARSLTSPAIPDGDWVLVHSMYSIRVAYIDAVVVNGKVTGNAMLAHGGSAAAHASHHRIRLVVAFTRTDGAILLFACEGAQQQTLPTILVALAKLFRELCFSASPPLLFHQQGFEPLEQFDTVRALA